jgi:hypothetical protein
LQHSAAGDVSVATENARRTQEDIHRLAMPAGSSIVYRVSEPISGWRVFVFAQSGDTRPTFETSTDGRAFAAVQAERQVNPAGRGDYGYLVPVLFEGTAASRGNTFLRVSLPDSTTADGLLEVSRVEIDFDSRN